MEHATPILVSLGLVLYGLVSRRLSAGVITAPIVFVLFGLLGGPGAHVLALPMDHAFVHVLAEATLILVLFADASRIDLRVLRRDLGVPVRLLGIGLPLTIAAGAVVAHLMFPDLTLWECATLAAVLAPTDAALGQAVVSSPSVPLALRQSLSVESGLNDGIALPAVLLFGCLASDSDLGSGYWVQFALTQIGFGPLVGIAVGALGGLSLAWANGRGWVDPPMQRVSALALAFLAYALAEGIGGNGFIAAFVAGAAFGYTAKEALHPVHEFLEAEGSLLMLFVFLLFGAELAYPAAAEATPAVWIYVALSLTVIRMLPVALSVMGAKLPARDVLFLGWFGPRGLATILFGLLILDRTRMPHVEFIAQVAMAAALASVFAHGLTAAPAVRRYDAA
ncbi:MAG: cation:proton antiporter [Myxococcota bacterium]